MKKLIPFLLFIILASCDNGVAPEPDSINSVNDTPVGSKLVYRFSEDGAERINLDTVEVEQYHISVIPFGSFAWWTIYFTNDNWKTKSTLLDWSEITGIKTYYLVPDKQEAITFAKRFKTYQSCLDHNAWVINNQSKLRNRKEIKIH